MGKLDGSDHRDHDIHKRQRVCFAVLDEGQLPPVQGKGNFGSERLLFRLFYLYQYRPQGKSADGSDLLLR